MRIRRGYSIFVLAAAAAIPLACAKGTSRPTTSSGDKADLQVVTVAVVQGGGDKSFAHASEFLTGCRNNRNQAPPFGTCARPVLHLPQALKEHARHLHLDPTVDYSSFYLDERVRDGSGQPGGDANSNQGLEGSNLIFYSGHGKIDNFFALGGKNPIRVADFSLGDHNARYLLMLSCNVFAHGPLTSGDFSHPEFFEVARIGSASSGGHANVFERWTRSRGSVVPLNQGLRLACGGTSHIGGGDHPTEALWYYYSKGFGPADAFLLGFYKPESVGVPLCISRGDKAEDSGLFDHRFVAGSPGGGSHIFIEYPVDAGEQDSLLAEAAKTAKAPGIRYSRQRESRTDDPAGLPVLGVDPAPTPPFLGGLDFSKAPLLDYGFRGASAAFFADKLNSLPAAEALPIAIRDDVCIKGNPKSGAVIISLQAAPGAELLSGDSGSAFLERMVSAAIRLVVGAAGTDPGSSVDGFVLREGQPIEMQIDGVPARRNRLGELSLNELSHARKCRHLRLTRVYRNNGKEVPIMGEGGELLFSICPTSDSAGGSDGAEDACRRTFASQLFVSIAGRSPNPDKTETSPEFAFPTLDAGMREAVRRLVRMQEGSSYDPKPRASRWGYKAAPSHCTQEKMYIVYEFEFAPKPDHEELPPIVVEVPAHRLPAPLLEETWTCAPEKSGSVER